MSEYIASKKLNFVLVCPNNPPFFYMQSFRLTSHSLVLVQLNIMLFGKEVSLTKTKKMRRKMNKTSVVPKYLYVLFSCRRLTVNVKASNTNYVMKIILQEYKYKHSEYFNNNCTRAAIAALQITFVPCSFSRLIDHILQRSHFDWSSLPTKH